MAYVAGCLMACFSFLLNKVLLKLYGQKIIISYSPLMEESAKTLFAYAIGADILLTHVTFGCLEAGYDLYQGGHKSRQAAVSSILSHSLFGMITIAVYSLSGSIMVSLAAGFTVHWLCNVIMINLSGS